MNNVKAFHDGEMFSFFLSFFFFVFIPSNGHEG